LKSELNEVEEELLFDEFMFWRYVFLVGYVEKGEKMKIFNVAIHFRVEEVQK
jgi:hypothetical protein